MEDGGSNQFVVNKLEQYNYLIIYKPRKVNKIADALSWTNINHFKERINLNSRTSIFATNQNDSDNKTDNIDDIRQQRKNFWGI